MYRCQTCNQVSKPREPQFTVVVETREVTYKNGSKGTEIVKELKVCEKCVTFAGK